MTKTKPRGECGNLDLPTANSTFKVIAARSDLMCSQWLILLFSLTFASIGVAQTPTRNPEVPPVSKSNGSQVAQQHKETQHNEYQSKGKSTLVNKSAADDKSDGSNTNEDVERSLAQFTFWLVIVRGLQFAVLLLQFFVLRHHANLIRR